MFWPAASLLLATLFGIRDAAPYREVPVRIEPAQPLKAIAIRSADNVVPIEIRGGNALVPWNLPLPWTLSIVRFETTTYTQADLEQKRPLAIRELGVIRGFLRGVKPVKDERFTFLLWRGGPNHVEEVEFVPDDTGDFNVSIPAGVYQGAVLGQQSGTRIRSAIVVDPGRTTNVGQLIAERTSRIAVRVVDGKRHRPVAGSTVAWAPPSALNSEVAKVLYARRWSTVTDARGVAVFTSVGPPPIPLRWRVSASGYAVQVTRPFELRGAQSVSLPDVGLLAESTIVIRVQLPRYGGAELRNGKIVLGDPDEANTLWFMPVMSAALREGDVKFVSSTYGRKRLWVENASGRKLLYRDFETTSEKTIVDLALLPADIHGQIKRGASPIDGAVVRVADPHEAKTVLALAKTDSEGYYRLTTFQSGHINLYAIESNHPGTQSSAVSRELDVNGRADYQVDFDLPDAGAVIRIVDAATGEPLQAVVDKRLTYRDGGAHMSVTRTDNEGRLVLNGFPEGTGHLYVRAPGHYAREVDIALTDKPMETVIKLEKSRSISGQVVDVSGAPIAGAKVAGGYYDELVPQAPFETITDETGHFRFDFAPEPGTAFYVIAARHSLGITTLQPDHENMVTLFPPGRGAVFLLPGNAPPTKLYLVMAAPAGGNYIPLGALYDLAEVNGMRSYQLLGTAKDGNVALPEFLPPGTYHLYVMLKGGKPKLYQMVGTLALPADRDSVLTFSEH
jgi:hypothetical protein